MWEVLGTYATIYNIMSVCTAGIPAANLTNFRNVSTHTARIHVNATRTNWWEAGKTGCNHNGSNLFVPGSLQFPTRDTRILPDNTYWVGAMVFQSWNWTGDDSSLYQYGGYMHIQYMFYVDRHSVSPNSALECHTVCGLGYYMIGLQDDMCFCLRRRHVRMDWTLEEVPGEVRCSGNYYDRCGNDEDVSLYSVGEFTELPVPSSRCGYVSLTRNTVSLRFSDFCEDLQECSVCEAPGYRHCHGTVCMDTDTRPWVAVHGWCRLAKLTTKTREDISRARIAEQCPVAWIGLKKHDVAKWIDGSDVHLLPNLLVWKGTTTGPKCLAAIKVGNYFAFYWDSCSKKHVSLCATATSAPQVTKRPPPAQTTPRNNTTITSTTTSSHVATSPTRTNEVNIYPTSATNQSTLKYPAKTSQESGNKQELHVHAAKHIGVYIGGVLGSVLVVASAALVGCLIYRRKMFCFEIKDPIYVTPARNDLPAPSNPSYVLPSVDTDECLNSCSENTLQCQVGKLGIPVGVVKPSIYQNVRRDDNETDKVDDNNKDDIGNRDSKNSSGNDINPSRAFIGGGPSNVVSEEKLDEDCYYENTDSDFDEFEDDDALYEYVNYKQTYQCAKEVDGSHTRMPHNAAKLPSKDGHIQTFHGCRPSTDDDEYNTLTHQAASETLSGCSRYDRMVSEDTYDTAHPSGTDNVDDDGYSNTITSRQRESRDIEDCEEDGELYTSIEDRNIDVGEQEMRIDKHLERVYSNTGTHASKDGESNEGMTYYNLGYVGDSQVGMATSDNGNNNNMYSLAVDIDTSCV